MALRLRRLAAPGTILLSAATERLVQEDVLVEPQGEVTVGAVQAPVDLRAVLVPLGRSASSSTACVKPKLLPRPWAINCGWGKSLSIWPRYFWLMGDPERTIELGERALPLPRPLEISPSRSIRISSWARATGSWATTVGR